MGTKRTPQLVSAAKRMRADGRSFGEIAAELSKQGKSISKASVMGWLKGSATASPRPAAPVASPPVAHATPPPSAPAAEDGSEVADMTPDELRSLLAGAIRREQAEADRARSAGQLADARQASKLVAVFTAQLQRIHARQDEDTETVRVNASEMQAAADRAMAGLASVAERVAAERATWPRCSGCGQPVGAFVEGDKSAVRGLFERVCR
jgi:hypothetical protein